MKSISIRVPYHHLLGDARWIGEGPYATCTNERCGKQVGRDAIKCEHCGHILRESWVCFDVHAGADLDRFFLAAAEANGNLEAAILLKHLAKKVNHERSEWGKLDAVDLKDAFLEVNLLRAADLDIIESKAQRLAADSSAQKKNKKRKALADEFAPFFEAAYRELEFTKSGTPRKNISDKRLAEVACNHAIRASKAKDFHQKINATSAGEWRERRNT